VNNEALGTMNINWEYILSLRSIYLWQGFHKLPFECVTNVLTSLKAAKSY